MPSTATFTERSIAFSLARAAAAKHGEHRHARAERFARRWVRRCERRGLPCPAMRAAAELLAGVQRAELRPVCIPGWLRLSDAEVRQMAHRGERPI